jgi:hypothetical protein
LPMPNFQAHMQDSLFAVALISNFLEISIRKNT